jgi:hypothetical protein
MVQLLYLAGQLCEHLAATTVLQLTTCCYQKTAVANMRLLVLLQVNFHMVLPLHVG